ncbi:MAG: galactokinase [Desulfobacterales bacterium]
MASFPMGGEPGREWDDPAGVLGVDEPMANRLTHLLESTSIESSAPCRIDMGGTLDISTFFYALGHVSPCTFNAAINLRTRVKLLPFREGMIKVSSTGFDSAEYPIQKAPFDHPLGLMFAIAAYFNGDGIHIEIDSASPPRSALGGSSAAAVALIGAFLAAGESVTGPNPPLKKIVMLAHGIEASVAGVPCGIQDQLAAAYGGVHGWFWPISLQDPPFRGKAVIRQPSHGKLQQHLLLAYCGVPHISARINAQWIQQFLSGTYRESWEEIATCTGAFVDALSRKDFGRAAACMNREVSIRREMTPDVLDRLGEELVDAAVENRCGARFTGAGGGGCIWAIGPDEPIRRLRPIWEHVLTQRKDARMLEVEIDSTGLTVSVEKMP